MDVHLLVYDLSQGLARNMSMGLLGFQLDAIYHTSIELNGREYVYDGGIVSIIPGSSHLGRPLERLPLGKTELPMDVVQEYIESLRPIFTAEAYDLFKHNCNNFSDSLATFLVGEGIPDHILHMPQAVLDSPMGRMLLPQLTQSVNATRQRGSILGIQDTSQAPPTAAFGQQGGRVRVVNNLQELDTLLDQAKASCAVVFFTSATCPPCKAAYPLYDQLAAEVGERGYLIKVDIGHAFDVGQRYSVRATPTFTTFLKDGVAHAPSQVVESPDLLRTSPKPVLYSKVPPVPKLLAKMGAASQNPAVADLTRFIASRDKDGPASATLPDVKAVASFIQESVETLPIEVLFSVVDLFRCALADARMSGFFAEEAEHKTVASILTKVNESTSCPYALRLVTLQMAQIIELISSSFLDDAHSNTRVSAASLMFNVTLANEQVRRGGHGHPLPEDDQVELAASVLEAIGQEDSSPEALHGMLAALGHLVYETPLDSELADLLRALDAESTVTAKKKVFPNQNLVTEKETPGVSIRNFGTMAAIPITIVTGFLGAGKTTLILNLIPQLKETNPDYKLALLKNEFGDLAVDSQLASSNAISGVRELLNGCICCNLVGQLGEALEQLRETVTPDRIIVGEETGRYTLDGVVSVIDVENWEGYEDTSYTARIQARYTDLVVFNKWEPCSEMRFDICLDRLGDLEVDVAWVKSKKGWVSADLIFGVDGALAKDLAEHHGDGAGDGHEHDHDHGHAHKHNHQSEVEVLSVEVSSPETGSAIDTTKLMSLLKAAPKDEVYRIKSVLTLSAAPHNSDDDEKMPAAANPRGRYILNWAFGRWTFNPLAEEASEHESSDKTTLRMTMIFARYSSTKWKKKLEAGGFLDLEGDNKGELKVTKIA
ncbi:unnamed protein product [Parascedosporium putredinis]|uniref:Thioredoxin domain-containing protein n=1 Tax=Parascedosporium putredinis TaxID=1442378 RepID=A0A9P1GU99_9PEZI|nr:unnamed protein product [Parascedosporium putredinis]CAI7987495.1 unnamed protein product [Parascedosporium putredinis]